MPEGKVNINDLRAIRGSIQNNTEYNPEPLQYNVPSSRFDEGFLPYKPTDFSEPLEESLYQYRGSNQNKILPFAGRFATGTIAKLGESVFMTGGAIASMLPGVSLNEGLNNGGVKLFEDFENWGKESIPVWDTYTQKYKDMSPFQKITDAAWWADSGSDMAAFVASAWISGYAVSSLVKGIGLGKSMANTIDKISKSGKFFKESNIGELASRGINIAKLGENIDHGAIALQNAFSEGLFEARGVQLSVTDGLKNKNNSTISALNSIYGIDTSNMSDAEISYIAKSKGLNYFDNEKIDSIASKSAANTAALNLLWLTGPSWMETGMMFSSFKGIKNAGDELVSKSIKDNINIISSNIAKAALIEGPYEENIQLATSDYFTQKAIGDDNRDIVNGIVGNWLKNFTTNEGIENILSGSLMGVAFGAIGSVRNSISEKEHINKINKLLDQNIVNYRTKINDFYKHDSDDSIIVDKNGNPQIDEEKVKSDLTNYISTNYYNKLESDAVKNNDIEAFKAIRKQKLAGFAIPYFQNDGTSEKLEKDIDLLSKADANDFSKIKDYNPDGSEVTSNQLKNEYKRDLSEYRNIYDNVIGRHAGLLDLKINESKYKESVLPEISKLYNVFKQNLISSQYVEGVKQYNFQNQLNDINDQINSILAKNDALSEDGTIKNKIDSDKIKYLKSAKKYIKEALDKSYSDWDDLTNKSLQQKAFEEQANELSNQIIGKEKEDKEFKENEIIRQELSSEISKRIESVNNELDNIYKERLKEHNKNIKSEKSDDILKKSINSEKSLKKPSEAMNVDDELFANYDGMIGKLSIIDGQINFSTKNKSLDIAPYETNNKFSDLGITILNQNIFDLEITNDGNSFTLNGRKYTFINKGNIIDSIEENKSGEPISVKLFNNESKIVKITNKAIVEQLSYYIRLLDELKYGISEKLIKSDGQDFIIIKDNQSAKDYYVYNKNNNLIVTTTNGKSMSSSNPVSKRVISLYNDALIQLLNNAVKYTNEELSRNKEQIRNELISISKIIRQATPKEIVEAKSVGEIQGVEGDTEQEKENKEDTSASSSETSIIENSISMSMASNDSQPLMVSKSNKLDAVDNLITTEILSDDEITNMSEDDKVNRKKKHKGVLHPDRSIAWLAENNKEFDDFVSNPLNNKELNNAKIEIVVDYEEDYGDEFKGIKFFSNKDKKIEFNDEFVDEVPLKIIIQFDSLKFSRGLYVRRTANENIFIPSDVVDVNSYINEKKLEIRAFRRSVLNEINNGSKVLLNGLNVSKGTYNAFNSNRSIKEALGIEPKDAKIGVCDNSSGIINTGDGVPMVGFGSKGGVYLETNMTCNGQRANIKLNPSKLSQNEAVVLFHAIVQAYTMVGGYNTIFNHPDINNLTSGEIIDILVNFERNKNNEANLINKVLYVKNKVLFFGDNNKVNLENYSEQDITKFVYHISKYKNKKIDSRKLNYIYDKNFKLLDISVKKGQSYKEMIVANEFVRTDVYVKNNSAFSKPVIEFNPSTINFVKKEESKKESTTKESLVKRATKKSFSELSENDELFVTSGNDDILIAKVVNKNNNLVLSIKDKDPELKVYNNSKIDDSYEIINDLLMYPGGLKIRKSVKKEERKTSDDLSKELFSPFTREYQGSWVDGFLNDVYFDKNKFSFNYKIQDIENEFKWLKDRFPNLDVKIINKLINLDGLQSFATFSNDGITLYNAAEEGTLYHEAFHNVSLKYLTSNERFKIYDEARDLFSIPEDKDDRYVEEVLAEEFRKYALLENKYNGKVFKNNKIIQFFKDLYNFIKSLFVGNNKLDDLDIRKLFDMIQLNRFRYRKESSDSINIDNNKPYLFEVKNVDLKTIKDSSVLNTVVKNLVYIAFKTNNVKYEDLNSVKNINIDNVSSYLNNAINRFSEVLSSYNEEEAEYIDIKSKIDLYSEIISNFDSVFIPILRDYLAQLNVKMTGLDLVAIEDGVIAGDVLSHDKLSFESSAKENTLSTIKMLIATLPKSFNPDPVTGMYEFVDFGPMWIKLHDDLEDSDNIYDMMSIIESKKSDAPYLELYNRLQNPDNEKLRTQFEVEMNMHKHKFVNVIWNINNDGSISYKFTDPSNLNNSSYIISEWNQSFIESGFFNQKTGEFIKGSESSLLKSYDLLLKRSKLEYDKFGEIKNIEQAKDEIIRLFGSISVFIDSAIIDKLISNEDFKDIFSLIQSMSKVFSQSGLLSKLSNEGSIKNYKGENLASNKIFNNESIIKTIANVVSTLSGNDAGHTVIGPDGAMYYSISLNNFVSDTMRYIRKDDSYLNKLKSVLYNQNSYFLKKLSDDNVRKSFKVRTASAFIEENTKDSGRSYVDVSRSETFLFKLHSIQNNLLPFPTLADKRTYYLYEGIDKFDVNYIIDNGNLRLSDDVIDLFYGYYIDELERIKYESIRVQSMDRSLMIKNYHYKGNTSNIVDGNAFKFNLFSEITRENKDDLNNFNFLYNGKIVTESNIRSIINDVLTKRINDTIDLAKELELINIVNTKNKKDVILGSDFIDKNIIEKFKKKYNNNDIAIRAILAEFEINNIISIVETEKILTFDPSYYKDKDDKIKRLSAITSTGNILRTDYRSKNELNDIKSYNTSTLNSVITKSDFYDIILNKQVDQYKLLLKDKYSNDQELVKVSLRLAKSNIAKFLDIDQTDAQVYISPEMHRNILLRLGEWSEDKQIAYDLLESDKDLSLEDELSALNIVMQPLKMIYFGPSFSKGIAMPIYDKMSLATLFKRFVKNTQLEDFYNRMNSIEKYSGLDKIYCLKFDSAVKVGVVDPMNVKRLDLSTITTISQDFKYLRRQLNTDPHEVEESTVGTQFKKVMLSNIKLKDEYGSDYYYTLPDGEKISGSDLINSTNDIMSYLSKEGLDSVLKSINGSYDNNGNFKLDNTEKLRNLLIEDSRQSGLPDNIINALSQDFSIDALPERKSVQNRIAAMIGRDVIDLKLPGNAFIQMTNYGLKEHSESSDLRFINEDGYMEVMVSINLFKSVIKDYDKKTFEEKVEYLNKNPQLTALAYRIPTQAQNSVAHIKIVKFLREQVGDTIIFPKEITGLAGSDFDIDKVYVIRHNYYDDNGYPKKVKFINLNTDSSSNLHKIFNNRKSFEKVIDFDKFVEKYKNKDVYSTNGLKASQNRLIDLWFSVMNDPNHSIETKTSLDAPVDTLKTKAKEISKLEGSESIYSGSLYEYGVRYQLDVKDKYNGGKSGLGPFALNNVHHSLTQIFKTSVINFDENVFNYSNKDNRGNISLHESNDVNLMSIIDQLSALISAHVDIAKDPYIFKLNVNNMTINSVAFLVRIGFGENTFNLICQPIIKDLAKEFNKLQGKLGNKYISELESSSAYQVAYNIIENKYKKNITSKNPSIQKNVLNPEFLLSQIDKNVIKDSNFYSNQLELLKIYNSIHLSSKELSALVQSSQIDTKKYGNTASEIYVFLKKLLSSMSSNKLINSESTVLDSFLYSYLENGVLPILDILKNMTITGSDSFMSTINEILRHYPQSKHNDIIKIFSDGLFSSIVSEFFTNNMNIDSVYINELVNGKDSIFNRLIEIKTNEDYSDIKNNGLLNVLKALHSNGLNDVNRIVPFLNKDRNDKFMSDQLTYSWKDLLTDNRDFVRKFAEDLVIYSFYTSGFRSGLYNFYQYIPYEYLDRIGYNKFFKDKLKEFNYIDSENKKIENKSDKIRSYISKNIPLINNIKDVYMNNWNNGNLVKSISYKELNSANEIFKSDIKGIPSLLDSKYKGNFFKYFDGNDYYLYENIAFKQVSENKYTYLYKLINKLGYSDKGFNIYEYGMNKSIFNKNNVNEISDDVLYKYIDENQYITQNEEIEISNINSDVIFDIDNVNDDIVEKRMEDCK